MLLSDNISWILDDPKQNVERIFEVEKLFGFPPNKLVTTNRVLVGEGVLTKICRRKPKLRHFFLFNDILIYGRIVVNRKVLRNPQFIDLADSSVKNVVDNGIYRNGFSILSPRKSFTVYASTSEEKIQWMVHLKKCISSSFSSGEVRKTALGKLVVGKLNKQTTKYCLSFTYLSPTFHIILIQPIIFLNFDKAVHYDSVKKSPIWIPDSEASHCMVCGATEFNLVHRRHHCRHCGKVVCDKCSTYRWILPYQGSSRVRVCSLCHTDLSTEKNNSAIHNDHQQQNQCEKVKNTSNNPACSVANNKIGIINETVASCVITPTYLGNANMSNDELNTESDTDSDTTEVSLEHIHIDLCLYLFLHSNTTQYPVSHAPCLGQIHEMRA
ncbi:Pleckstrin homology domain-containing family F member 2 [Schistosoma japonicum]|nr:Pleckstrin homology domain-containing family F member 2 [Schistosoma japonicum]